MIKPIGNEYLVLIGSGCDISRSHLRCLVTVAKYFVEEQFPGD